MFPLHFVQRLDYATSGVLCIAKNKTSAAKAGKMFEKRYSKKYYLAVLRGHVNFEVADIEFHVGKYLNYYDIYKLIIIIENCISCLLMIA